MGRNCTTEQREVTMLSSKARKTLMRASEREEDKMARNVASGKHP